MIDPDEPRDDTGSDGTDAPDEAAESASEDIGTASEEVTDGGDEGAEAEAGADAYESPWARLFAGEPSTHSPMEELVRERFERLAADILHKRLGASVKDDGTADLSDVTQDQFSDSMPDLGVDMLKTYLKAIKPAIGLASEVGEDGKPLENPFEGVDLSASERAHLKQAADDIQLVLGMMGKDADSAKEDVLRLVERIKGALGDKLGDVLDALGGGKKGSAPAFTRQAIQNALGDRLIGVLRQLGNVVEASRRQGVRLEPFARENLHAPPPSPPAEAAPAAATPTPTPTGETAKTDEAGGEVIFLEEVRQRLDDKREQLSGLNDVLTKIFTDAGGSASSGGPSSVNLDGAFFKEHGPALLQQLFDGFSKTIPQKVELTLPMTSEEQPPAPEPAESDESAQAGDAEGAAEPAVKVSVNLNLASLLGGLFRSKSPSSEDR